MKYDQITVLIPAYKPDEKLVKLVDDLIAADLRRIVVVDDGGGEAYKPIFDAIREKAHVLTHPVNRGKGAALKTGLKHIMKKPGGGVVTADADGQHTPADIARIADVLLEKPDTLVIGSRDKKAMPPRSKAGNTLTCAVFGLLTGLWLNDTQTGLRGLPKSALEAFSDLEGDRYEYEINMLIAASRMKMPVEEVTIDTIYIDDNASSHFNALKDGLKIYKLMFREAGKFCLSSIICFVVDYIIFILLHHAAGASRILSQIGGRVVSAPLNYWLNSRMVFKKQASGQSLGRYFLLAGCVLAASCLGHWLLELIHVPAVLAKILVDGVLYVVSYRVQRSHVFGAHEKNL
ncbi:MAG: bifunctional glycosyltransferase family 2/GtrA family protein [Clostridia bacterium]|nr:bifunctional glycosyltransferase family 2/GtrA family protein [Clostridia bacterium]